MFRIWDMRVNKFTEVFSTLEDAMRYVDEEVKKGCKKDDLIIFPSVN